MGYKRIRERIEKPKKKKQHEEALFKKKKEPEPYYDPYDVYRQAQQEPEEDVYNPLGNLWVRNFRSTNYAKFKKNTPVSKPTDTAEIEADREAKQAVRESKQSPGNETDPYAGLNKMLEILGMNPYKVNIHNDQESHEMADQLNAKAFTHGNDIYFGKDQYKPHTEQGQEVIAHELSHVKQQEAAGPTVQMKQNDTLEPATDIDFNIYRNFYIVRQGDTLVKIVERLNKVRKAAYTVDDLLTANKDIQAPHLIRPGQKINFPSFVRTGEPEFKDFLENYYVVRPHDTLWSIVQNLNKVRNSSYTVEEILALNKGTISDPKQIKPYQQIQLPALTTTMNVDGKDTEVTQKGIDTMLQQYPNQKIEFPAFKLDFDTMKVSEFTRNIPQGLIIGRFSFYGEAIVQKQGHVSSVYSLRKHMLEVKDTAQDMVSSFTFGGYSPTGKNNAVIGLKSTILTGEWKCSAAIEGKKVVGKIAPRPIELKINDYIIKGTLGMKLEFELVPKTDEPVNWEKVFEGLKYVGLGIIIILFMIFTKGKIIIRTPRFSQPLFPVIASKTDALDFMTAYTSAVLTKGKKS